MFLGIERVVGSECHGGLNVMRMQIMAAWSSSGWRQSTGAVLYHCHGNDSNEAGPNSSFATKVALQWKNRLGRSRVATSILKASVGTKPHWNLWTGTGPASGTFIG